MLTRRNGLCVFERFWLFIKDFRYAGGVALTLFPVDPGLDDEKIVRNSGQCSD
jgi:hypothetical protein